jgi:leader peptidase (prepilin peptidase)/N-methyltransferase
MEPLELVAAFALGLLVGSFLNVCILRIPADESIVHPRSRCPTCQTPLPWWANVPVVSYLALRGRCAFCAAAISPRYMLVELLTGALFAAVYARFGATAQGLVATAFVSGLVVLTFIDIDHRIIPDVISLPGIAVGFAASWLPGGVSPESSAAGAALGGGVLAGIGWLYAWWARRGGLGMGDIKLLAMIGAFLGWTAIPATIIIASLSGSVFGIPAILVRGRHLRPRAGLRAGLAFTALGLVFFWALRWLLGASAGVPVPGPRELAAALMLGGAMGLLVTVRLAARRYPIPFGPFLALGALACLLLEPGPLASLGL